ncbi:GTP-binding protein [Tulasnella sp. 330]|nr:GTP-binding protein [Tulasnella sp. 330]
MSINNGRSSEPELISFNGRDGEEVTEFLRSVKRVALAEGRQRDDQWLMDYTESCLAGPALQWHLYLEDKTLSSWRGLQRALLNRFAPMKAAPTVPEPAPAAFRPIEVASSAPPLPSQSDLKRNQGDFGVGKSCLLARSLYQLWAPFITPMTGVDYEIYLVIKNDKQYTRHYWDISGHPRYRSLTEEYLGDVDSFWFVYDITNRKSFESIRKWAARARESSPQSNNLNLIANKKDLSDKRAVSLEEAKALAVELKLLWHGEMSAKTNAGVQYLWGGWTPGLKKLSKVV